MDINQKFIHHISNCKTCLATPADMCDEGRELGRRRVKALQYYDETIARAQESNPEWYEGSPHSPFFTRF